MSDNRGSTVYIHQFEWISFWSETRVWLCDTPVLLDAALNSVCTYVRTYTHMCTLFVDSNIRIHGAVRS